MIGMRRVAVIGVGFTKVGEHWNSSLRDLYAQAVLRAVSDADLELRDIQAMFIGNMSSGYLQAQEHLGSLLATHLGIQGIAAVKIEAACGSGGAAFHQAVLAVASGYYDFVIAGGIEKMTDVRTEYLTSALIMADDQEFVASTGVTFPGLNALIYRLYMEKYNVRQEDIAQFPVHEHFYAQFVEHAQYRYPITLEQVLESTIVADPIRLLECSPISDGAAAVVLCPLDIAMKRRKEGIVEVIGSALSTDAISLNEREDPTTFIATVKAAKRAYRMAKIEPRDVDVVEVHDAYSILGIINLEDLGFAEKGKGVRLVKEGEIARDGRIPTNLSGGLKARGHPVGATGIYQVAEIVKQLRGDFGKNQVDDAEIGLAQSIGGVGGTVIVNILKRIR